MAPNALFRLSVGRRGKTETLRVGRLGTNKRVAGTGAVRERTKYERRYGGREAAMAIKQVV